MARVLLPLLIVFVMLGHACEWGGARSVEASSGAGKANHHQGTAGEHRHDSDANHHGDGHSDEARVSCEVVEVAVNAGIAPADHGIDGVAAPSVAPERLILEIAPRPERLEEHAPRLPLFLLHASLLI